MDVSAPPPAEALITDEPVPEGRAPKLSASHEKLVDEIISKARQQQVKAVKGTTAGRPWLSGLASAVLLWLSFAPANLSPLAFLAPVPLLWCCIEQGQVAQRNRALYTTSFLGWLATLQWMRLGDMAMIPAWLALSLYLAVYAPLFVGLTRVAVWRFRWPLVLAAPAVWMGLEYARAHLLTGFAWYQLGHSQYRWLSLIQVSDVFGAYAVSGLVVMAGSSLLLVLTELKVLKTSKASTVAEDEAGYRQMIGCQRQIGLATGLFVVALGYGQWQLSRASFTPGPRAALIQCNFPASLQADPNDAAPIYNAHNKLTGLAVREQPDLIVWPESMFRWPLFDVAPGMTNAELEQAAPAMPPERWRDPTVKQALENDSLKAGAALIYGAQTFVPKEGKVQEYNSAVFVTPTNGVTNRYDKIHRVPFGEYLPLKETLPWLQMLTPYPPDWGLSAGTKAAVFEYKGWRLLPVICFEDTVPHLVRGLVSSASQGDVGQQVDVLVNLSNDGWFHGSSELDQHLVTSVFRAVECRTPLIRAVNTGISAFVDGNGAILDPEKFIDGDRQNRTSARDTAAGDWLKEISCAQVGTIPLDRRTSWYVAYGDWFGMTCGLVVLGLMIAGVRPRRVTA